MKLEESEKKYNTMKRWPKGVERHLDYPEISLSELLKQAVSKYPNSDVLWFEGFSMTYKEFDTIVDQLATGLSKLGVGKGDIVAVDLPNVPQYLISHFAILRLGATTNPLMPVNRYVEIVHQVNDAKSKVLIILDFLYEEYLDGKDLTKMPTLEALVFTETAEYLPSLKAKLGKKLKKVPFMEVWPEKVGNLPVHKFQDLILNGTPINIPEHKIDVKNDIAILIYTGGTTGVPKGVATTHYNMIVNSYQAYKWVRSQISMEKYEGDGGISLVVPLAHSFGNIGMTVGLIDGWKSILFPRPPAKFSKILKVNLKQKATFMPGVPTLWNKINQDPKSAKFKGKLKDFIACVSGAAALPLEVKEKFESITGALIIEGYGMSEFSPLMTMNPLRDFKIGTVGLPAADTYLKIVDAEEGKTILPPCPNDSCENCGTDEFAYIGEICANGPQMMKGYLGRKKDSDYALRKDEDGVIWYFTSDIGCVDSEGYLHIKDRKRDMIKYKGHGVFPREVEDLMYMNEAVDEVGVIGVPDPEAGQTIKAFVSIKPEFKGKVSEESLLAWCKENISPTKYPRQLEIVPELPKSVVGKILRRELRKEGE
jgi:long-chain acyl-CoA synthetase